MWLADVKNSMARYTAETVHHFLERKHWMFAQ